MKMEKVVLVLERDWQRVDARGSNPSFLRLLVGLEKVIRPHRGRGAAVLARSQTVVGRDRGRGRGGCGGALKTETQL